MNLRSASNLGIGHIVRIDCGLYFHFAIVAGHTLYGEPILWSISGVSGHRFQQTLSELTQGRYWEDVGYWGSLNPTEVLQRAWEIAHRQYNLPTWNCEHFVRYAHGLRPESVQFNSAIKALGLLGLIVAGAVAYRRLPA